nr:hypothetical protein GCM10020093_072330 [Planobispora longispora]
MTAASNVTGELWPIAALAHIAHRHGARILVDAAQLVPHRRVNLTALDLDYVVFSGHKLYAPSARARSSAAPTGWRRRSRTCGAAAR